MKLCYDETADVGELLSLLKQGVDPDINGRVCHYLLLSDNYGC